MLTTTPPEGRLVFYATPLQTVFVVNEDAKALYQAAEPWKYYDIVVMSTGIENTEKENDVTNIASIYDINGTKIKGKLRGPAIVRYINGSSRKMIVK